MLQIVDVAATELGVTNTVNSTTTTSIERDKDKVTGPGSFDIGDKPPALGLGRGSSVRQLLAPPPFQATMAADNVVDKPGLSAMAMGRSASIRHILAMASSDDKTVSRGSIVVAAAADGTNERPVVGIGPRSMSRSQVFSISSQPSGDVPIEKPAFLGIGHRVSSIKQMLTSGSATIYPTLVVSESNSTTLDAESGTRLHDSYFPPVLGKSGPNFVGNSSHNNNNGMMTKQPSLRTFQLRGEDMV